MPVPSGMTRRAIDVPDEVLAQLEAAGKVDGVPVATRLRAMTLVWADDPTVRERVDAAAVQVWEASRASKVSGLRRGTTVPKPPG